MTDDRRQQMNVRAIRVSLASALRHSTRDQTKLCIARARQLLEQARDETTDASVISDIRSLERELSGTGGVVRQREG